MRCLFISFYKKFTSPGFWLCVGMTIVLLFAAEVYIDGSQSRYSVIRALTELPPEVRTAEAELCDIQIMQKARSSWFTLFAPIIAAFCFVPLTCAEREENAVRFQVIRVSKNKYYVTEFISGIISGGLAIVLGYLIFCGAAAILFPGVSEIPKSEAENILRTKFIFPELITQVFLYGTFWSVPAMFLSGVLRNKYLIMCIPFFIKYGVDQAYKKLLFGSLYGDRFDEKKYKLASKINPDGILFVNKKTALYTAILFGALTVIFFAGYLTIMRKRGDRDA